MARAGAASNFGHGSGVDAGSLTPAGIFQAGAAGVASCSAIGGRARAADRVRTSSARGDHLAVGAGIPQRVQTISGGVVLAGRGVDGGNDQVIREACLQELDDGGVVHLLLREEQGRNCQQDQGWKFLRMQGLLGVGRLGSWNDGAHLRNVDSEFTGFRGCVRFRCARGNMKIRCCTNLGVSFFTCSSFAQSSHFRSWGAGRPMRSRLLRVMLTTLESLK